MHDDVHRDPWIQGVHAPREPLERCIVHQIRLGEQNAVRDGNLLDRLEVVLELLLRVERVDDADDPVETKKGLHVLVLDQGLHHGHRVRDAGGLDDDPLERRDLARDAARDELLQRGAQVAAQRAAQTPVVQEDGLVDRRVHEQVIESHLAELVHDHRSVRRRRMMQESIEQGGLAAAQETGEHDDRKLPIDPKRLRGDPAARIHCHRNHSGRAR